jgi:hypothetical protein
VEHGLHGSSGAAPLAKQLIEYYYGREQNNEAPPETVALQQEALE